MGILQIIWSALTIENQILISILMIPLSIFEATIILLLFTQLLNIQSNRKQKRLFIVIFSAVAIITFFIIPVPYNSIVNVFFLPLIVFLIFKTTILKSILAEILPYSIFVLIGVLVIKIYTFSLNISSDIVSVVPLHKTIYSLILYFCVFLLYIILKKFNINIQLLDNMKKRNIAILLINFIIGIIAIIIQAHIINLYADYIPSAFIFPIMFVSILYFSISIYSLFRTNKLEITTKNLEDEKLYNKTLTILYDNIRLFRHDFSNIVQAIGGYLNTENMEGLKKYYSQLVDDCKRVNSLTILSPEVLNEPAIYSLLTSKYHKADEMGINISIEAFLDLSAVNMKVYEFAKVIGILLDNAIDATNKCEEKVVNIVIRKDSKVKRHLFQIENTYTNKDINTDQIFEKGYTSKTDTDKKAHGLGLWEVRQILKKNNNLNLHTTKDDTFFKQQLEIYY